MHRTITPLEAHFRDAEDAWDAESKLALVATNVEALERAEELRASVERKISHRIQAMLKYLFGPCQKKGDKKAMSETVLKPLEQIVSSNVGDMGDPNTLMEEFALDEAFDPRVSETLSVMEEALHQGKDKDAPAAKKKALRELFVRRDELRRMAA